MESKLGAVEGLQTEAKEQTGQLTMYIAVLKQGNVEMNHRLDELTELLKKDILSRPQAPEVGSSQISKGLTSSTVISPMPQTPTHIATISCPLGVGSMGSNKSINWGDISTPPPSQMFHRTVTMPNPPKMENKVLCPTPPLQTLNNYFRFSNHLHHPHSIHTHYPYTFTSLKTLSQHHQTLFHYLSAHKPLPRSLKLSTLTQALNPKVHG